MRALTPAPRLKLAGPRAGLSAYSALPSRHPVLNHMMCPIPSLLQSPQRVGRDLERSLGFATRSQARQHTLPKQVRHPTGYPFASSCSPPRLAATQLLSTSCGVTPHRGDLRPTDKASSRTLAVRKSMTPQPISFDPARCPNTGSRASSRAGSRAGRRGRSPAARWSSAPKDSGAGGARSRAAAGYP
jgi:hypothetical protein